MLASGHAPTQERVIAAEWTTDGNFVGVEIATDHRMYRRRPSVVRHNKSKKVPKPRGTDGLTLYGFDRDTAIRLLRWAEDTAAQRAAMRRVEWADEIAA